MIRLEGAECLCNSLRTNRILTNLDLSYNALGSKAAGVLGAALMENNVSMAGPLCFSVHSDGWCALVSVNGNDVCCGSLLFSIAHQHSHRLVVACTGQFVC